MTQSEIDKRAIEYAEERYMPGKSGASICAMHFQAGAMFREPEIETLVTLLREIEVLANCQEVIPPFLVAKIQAIIATYEDK